MKGKTARFVRDVSGKEFHGEVHLYHLSEPIRGDKTRSIYVVVSKVNHCNFGVRVHETYIFPWNNKKGYVKDWGELEGSSRGEVSHAEALEASGYKVIDHRLPPRAA